MRLEFRGLIQSRYKQFLLELGGVEQTDAKPLTIVGVGWQAILEPEELISFTKALTIPRSIIHFSGELETVDRIVAQFRLKALRGGG